MPVSYVHFPLRMTMKTAHKKIITAAALVLVLGGLGTADYLTTRASVGTDPGTSEPNDGEGVAKNTGPNVLDVIDAEGFEAETSDDLTLLGQIVNMGDNVQSFAVLNDGDRAGSITWVEAADVKQIFNALKESLVTAFSSEMTGLRDQTLQEEGKPVRNILMFKDPAISEETIVFVRVRERLFEFHVANSAEEAMNELIEAVTGL